MAKEKRCSSCGLLKPVAEFGPRREAPDGLKGRCKACCRASHGAWRRANPEKVAAARRLFAERHPGKQAEIERRHRERAPERRAARDAVSAALQRGDLTKSSSCEDCGFLFADRSRIHAHHEDYSKPLEVEWLCVQCHGKRHRMQGADRRLS